METSIEMDTFFTNKGILCRKKDQINKALFQELGVKAGLRDEKGRGVLTGLTNISEVKSFEYKDGEKIPCDGQLLYRGYDVKDLIKGSSAERYAFEEATY